MKERVKTFLIVRFSSFGDIVQALNSVVYLKKSNPTLEITFLTKAEFFDLIKACPQVDKILLLNKNTGILELFKLAVKIRKKHFDYLYDAHHNLRTRVIKLLNFSSTTFIRQKFRIKRILLFKFRLNYFPKPFIGSLSYLSPIKSLLKNNQIKNCDDYQNHNQNLIFEEKIIDQYKNKIILCPSAAWDTKRWPTEKWEALIKLILNYCEIHILILGGPNDLFCKDFERISSRVTSLAGITSLVESCQIVKESKFIISGDTGLIHVADLLGVKGIELVGPSAFGYTFNKSISIIEQNLACKPCSKDGSNGCTQKIYKQCMKEISVEKVFEQFKKTID